MNFTIDLVTKAIRRVAREKLTRRANLKSHHCEDCEWETERLTGRGQQLSTVGNKIKSSAPGACFQEHTSADDRDELRETMVSIQLTQYQLNRCHKRARTSNVIMINMR